MFVPMCLAHGLLAQEPQFSDADGSPFSVEGRPTIVRVAPLNDDVHADIVVAHSRPPGISTWLGRGDGSFGSRAFERVNLELEPTEMVLADLNGDGVTDVVVGNHDSYVVFVYSGTGEGGLMSPPQTVTMREGSRPHTHGLAVADVNGDGLPDLITVNHEDDDVSIVLNKGDDGFEPAVGSPFSVSRSPYPLGVGDVNGDGIVDVAVPSTHMSGGGGEVTVLVGDGAGSFVSNVVAVRTPRPWFAVVGDVTGDGRDEIVVSHWERSVVSVLAVNAESGSWSEVPGSPFQTRVSTFEVAIADLDEDRDGDVIGVAGSVVAVLLSHGEGLSRAEASPFETGGDAWRLAVGDVNSDGRTDVVVSNEEQGTVSVLLGRR